MLSIEINTTDKIQQIILSGKLNGMDALQFRRRIESIIEDQSERVVLDVKSIEEIDLTGFNAVVILKCIAEKRGKTFTLNMPPDNPLTGYIHLSKLNLNQNEASN
jgi:anti-anti-sigma regulatory factor